MLSCNKMKAAVKEMCIEQSSKGFQWPPHKIPLVPHQATGKDSSLNMADIRGSGSQLYIRITRCFKNDLMSLLMQGQISGDVWGTDRHPY